MKFDKPAGENPIDQLKVVGRPHDRIDGPLKTTGTARYAYEWHEEAPNAAYGYIVGSAIAKGRLTALDTDAAQKAPGVLAVITASNAGALGKGDKNTARLLGGPTIEPLSSGHCAGSGRDLRTGASGGLAGAGTLSP
ncbi:putative xanthine dehydrogenase, molybdenum-binding subunit [Escherichia coli]|nr:putative xanthine dehydrogenase, molybdenum-binding subunit [Escherichia coli]